MTVDLYRGDSDFLVLQGELTRLPPEQIQEIQALKKEKQQLETEVERWDDSTNDLIVLAKDMGMMLVEMSDFTR